MPVFIIVQSGFKPNFDIFQRERLVAKLQHRTEAQGNTARIKTNTPLQGKPCAFDKSGIPGVFNVLSSLFSRES